MSEHLHHKLAVLQQNLIHGRLPRNLHWNEAIELIGHLGEVLPHGAGGEEFTFVVGAQREIFKKPHNAELGMDEVSKLRRLLKAAAADAPATPAPTAGASSAAAPPAPRMVVVIDHHAAHVFQDLGGSRPRDEVTIEPYDPHHYHHHLVHRHEAHYRGDRVPEETSFYEEVTEALIPAGSIVLIGHGTGKSSALEALVDYLKKHRADVCARVVATETADLSALTDPEIEAIAKRHMI